MKKIPEIIIRLLYGLLALLVISIFVYLFGHNALQTIIGGDIKLALSYATWIDKYFPKVPYWYPLSGAGESIVLGYHTFSLYVAVLFKHLSGEGLYQSFIIFQFLPLLLAPLAVYLYSSLRLKNQTVGLIAAVFYTLIPLAWTWIFDWGFYAQNFSLPLFTIGFLCFDWYFDEYFKDPASTKTKIGLLLFSILFTVTVKSHATTGLHLLLSIITFGLVYSLFIKGPRLKNLLNAIKAIFIANIGAIGLSAFFLLPFVRYSGIANKEGLNNVNPALLVPNPPRMFFQITPIESEAYYGDASYIYRNISIPVLVWLLAIPGAIIAIFKNRKVFVLFILAVLGTMLLVFPGISAFIIDTLPALSVIFDKRSWVPSILTFSPIVAAYFLYSTARAVYFPIFWVAKKVRQKFVSFIVISSHNFLIAITSIALAVLAGYLLRNVSIDSKYKNIIVNYGPNSYTNLYDVWKIPSNPCTNIKLVSEGGVEDCKPFIESMRISNWPRIAIPSTMPTDKNEEDIFAQLPKSQNGLYRMDISPNVGGLSKDMGIYSAASQVNSYTYQLSLIHSMWGYMQSVMYFTSVNDDPSVVRELSNLFGINKVFLYDKPDVYEKYQEAGWVNTYTKDLSEVESGWQVWESPDQTQLATLFDEPRVLVISDYKIGAYDIIYRLAIQGAMPYKNGLLFIGSKNIDDYSENELKKFDMVILNGYSYKSKTSAMKLIDSYVKNGGSLFIDTGWQYTAKDYEISDAPEFFPAEKLTWSDIGKVDKFTIPNSDIGQGVDAEKISPLIWNNVSWGISSAGSKANFRNGVEPILEANGTPIVTKMTYGKGKVVWSGFNFAAHAFSTKNNDEIKLLGNIWKYLLSGKTNTTTIPLSITRKNPDIVKFEATDSLNTSSVLYFREANYPNWQAKLISGGRTTGLKIYSAGPGFMAVLLPKISKGDQIIFSFKPGFLITAAKITSVITLIVILIWITPFGRGLFRIPKPSRKMLPGFGSRIKRIIGGEEEGDY